MTNTKVQYIRVSAMEKRLKSTVLDDVKAYLVECFRWPIPCVYS